MSMGTETRIIINKRKRVSLNRETLYSRIDDVKDYSYMFTLMLVLLFF